MNRRNFLLWILAFILGYRLGDSNMKSGGFLSGGLAEFAINIKSYGVKADGADITQQFINASNDALLLGVPLKLNKGTYLLNITSNINIPSIIGNNTELIINGNYSLIFDDDFLSYGVTYITNNVTNKLNTPTLNSLLKSKNQITKNITLRKVKFKANGVEDGSIKGNIAFNLAAVENLHIENVEFECFRMGVLAYKGQSKNIRGENIHFKNVETGFYISGSDNTSSVREFASDIKLTEIYHINTAIQAMNFYRLEGSDTFMLEKCKDVHLTNIHSENVTERSLYGSCVEDFWVDNVRVIDTNGVKLSGKIRLDQGLENYSVNCHLQNIKYKSVNKAEGLLFGLQFIKGIYIDCVNMDGNNIANAFLQIDNHAESLYINDINVENLKRSLLLYYNTGGIAGNDTLGIPFNPEGNYSSYLKNIEIKNVKAKNICQIDYRVFQIMDGGAQPVDGQYKFENITLKNIQIINQSVDQFGKYAGSTYKGLLNINHVKGLTITDCRVNGYSLADTNRNK